MRCRAFTLKECRGFVIAKSLKANQGAVARAKKFGTQRFYRFDKAWDGFFTAGEHDLSVSPECSCAKVSNGSQESFDVVYFIDCVQHKDEPKPLAGKKIYEFKYPTRVW